MAQILKAQGKGNGGKSKQAKRAYIAPRLLRISKLVSETRYDREAQRGFLDATG